MTTFATDSIEMIPKPALLWEVDDVMYTIMAEKEIC